MCLISKKEPSVSTEAKTVYKIVSPSLRSPVMKFKYELGKEYYDPLRIGSSFCASDSQDHNELDELYPDGNWYNVENLITGLKSWEKGFHAYTSIERAKVFKGSTVWDGFPIVECTIPAGSNMIEDREMTISDRIIINKIIE